MPDLLDIIAQRESGNQNVPNYKYGPGFSASGNFQMIDETWRRWAKAAGIDVSQYPRAIDAPYDVQRAVATHGLQTEGTKPWEAMKSYTPPAGVLNASGPAPVMAKDRADLERLLLERYPDLRVTSRDRDPDYNAKVGGAKDSQHTHGTAMDVGMRDIDPTRREEIARYARTLGAKGFGYYPNSDSMHFDMRPGGEAFWGQNYSRTSLPGTPEWFQKFAAEPGGPTPPVATATAETPPAQAPPGVLAAQGPAPPSGYEAFQTAYQGVKTQQDQAQAQQQVQQAQQQTANAQQQASAVQPNVPPQTAAADLMTALITRKRQARLPSPPGGLLG